MSCQICTCHVLIGLTGFLEHPVNEKPIVEFLMFNDQQLTAFFFTPTLLSHVALTSVKHFHRFHVQTHLQQISTDAISVHFI